VDLEGPKPGGEALGASEQRLRPVIDTIPGLVWSARPDGSAEFLNQQYLDYVGLSAEQAQDWGWTVAVHPDDRNRLAAYWQTVLGSGKQGEIEARIRRFDGIYRWFLFRANPLRDGSGGIVKWYGTNTDIEDRKLAEAEFRGSEEMHRIIFEAANDAVISIDEHGTILLANPATERIFGYNPAELIGRPLTILMPEYLRKLHAAGFGRYQLTGERHLNWQGTEVTGLRRNGLEFPAEVSFGEITRNGHRVFTGFIRDITEKKRAEETLRASEESLRTMVDSIPGLICIMTGEGQFDLANRKFLEYTGKTRSEMTDWLKIVHPDDLPSVVSRLTVSLETGCTFDTEVRLRRADSVYRWFQCCGLPLRDSEGQIVRWYKLLTDIEDRKRAEDALRTSERDLSAIINTIPMLAWSSRPDGFCDFLNQRWLDYTGLTAEQARGWGWGSAVHPDDVKGLSDYWQAALASGQLVDVEARMRRFDGEYRWFLFRASPLRDASGNIVKWYGTNTDIDDRKRAEEALRANERNFRLIVDTIPALICTMTPQGEVELVNRQIHEYFGLSLERLRNWSLIGAVADEDLPGVVARWRHSVATGEPYDIEHRIRREDGAYRWFHVRGLPLRDAEGRILRWYILLIDVEDRRRAEEALRASERDLSLIIETIPGMVWCAAPDGRIDYLNQRLLDYSGSTLADWARAGWADFLHPNDTAPMGEAWSKAVATGRTFEIQCRFRRSDGAYRWFQVLGEAARNSEGTVTRWYGLLLDIDDRKLMEEALRSTEARLSRAAQTAAVGELSASIAHEINQPLAAVVASAQACVRFLSAQPPNVARAQEAAESIVRDGKEAGEVVRRIRALFKRAAIEKAMLNLNDVIGEVLRLLASEAAKRQVAVAAELKQDLPLVPGDRVQLQQVLLNLLLNGIEALESVHDRSRKLAVRSALESPETVLVEVRDNGAGLENPDKVFEAFVTTKQNGMGMGLAICRSIVEAHNGRLWAVPTEGPGATFCFALPVRQSAES